MFVGGAIAKNCDLMWIAMHRFNDEINGVSCVGGEEF